MIARELVLADELNSLYQDTADDPAFDTVLRGIPAENDAELADLIEADGRLRLRLGRPVDLNRYLDTVPDLAGRSDPLDAAIDMALRALATTGRADEGTVRTLVAEYPRLGTAIRDAATLNNALWSTEQVRRHLASSPVKELPCDFGPALEGGVRRYQLRELLGAGAFGQVYLAVDRRLSEPDHPAFVSIKLLPGDNRSGWARQQLIDEATKARRINHANVARVLDRGVSGRNEDFLVYEFVEGGDLARWARRHGRTVPVGRAARLVTRIARGLHAAHMAGLVHCDLKPNNIVVTAEGEPKIADFGIAVRAEDRDGPGNTHGDGTTPVGNLAFMSPEQYRMEDGALTIPTDVYALGGILFWLLTGVLPNGSTSEEIRSALCAAERTQVPSLRLHLDEIDRDLDAICRRAMARRPEDRFSSAAEMAEDLDAWLRREPIPWTKPSSLRRLRLWVKRKPALAVALGVVVVLLIAGGAALQHFAAVAREHRFEAAVAAAGLEQEERYRQKFRSDLRDIIARLRHARANGLAYEVLPQIWLDEWLFGPTVLGDGPERFELWELRVQVVRDLLRQAAATGGEHALQTLVWESALGFWLVRDGRYGEAAPLLAENRSKWQAVVDPGDPWLVHLRAVADCATVGGYVDQPPASREAPAAVASQLEHAEAMLSRDEPGSPLHRLVLEHLLMLYAPQLLDRPQRRAQVEEALRLIIE